MVGFGARREVARADAYVQSLKVTVDPPIGQTPVLAKAGAKQIDAHRLGFGVSGPNGSPLVAARDTQRLIDRAFVRGVRLFDTGPSYGAGEAERRLGEALKRLPRHECIVSTKAGILAAGPGKRVRDFSPEGIRRSVEGSMKRLGVQRLDWLLLHGPAPAELTDELLKMLTQLKFKGDVAALGVAGRAEELDAALATDQFAVFMAPVHAALRPHDLERLGRIKASKAELVGIEALTPALQRFPAPLTSGAIWRLARSLLRRDQRVAKRTSMTIEGCLHWALFDACADWVVTTTTSLGHLESNISAVESLRGRSAIATM